MKYDVHIYAVVRVKVSGIEAESQVEAVKEADNTDLHSLLSISSDIEFADDVVDFLVDEIGDTEYRNTKLYHPFDGVGYALKFDQSIMKAKARNLRKVRLTPKQEQAYLEAPYFCPYCGTGDIESEHIDGDTLTAQVACNQCGRRWQDCYKVTGIAEEES